METLNIKNFGPIGNANISFGDLTILVGPQASGKSLLLELLKLVIDKDFILTSLRQYNYILNNDYRKVLDIYFGDGMSKIVKPDTIVEVDGKQIDFSALVDSRKRDEKAKEHLFYVPAQRILSIVDGRPRNFMEFDMATPYVLRIFSETLRIFLQGEMGDPKNLFPIKIRLKNDLKHSFDESIFHGGKVVMEEISGQKKMKIQIDDMSLPFMTWSAGQKEFMPLLTAFYCLSGPPAKVIKKDDYRIVVIEEPEMGLHPQAIISVLMEVLELLSLGKKVIISTHSTTVLEFAWAFNIVQKLSGNMRIKALCELLKVSKSSTVGKMLSQVVDKRIKTYYFSRKGNEKVKTEDISTLNAGDDDKNVSEWGGISAFSSRAAEIVYKYSDD